MEAHDASIDPALEQDVETTEQPLSLADELAADRARLGEERDPLDLPLPGYGDKLVARYRVLDGKELRKLSQRQRQMALQKDKQAEVKGMCDTLAAACVGFFTTRGDKLVALEDAGMPELAGVEVPVRYDRNLAKATRIEIDQTTLVREIVRQVFGGDKDLLLLAHYRDVDLWMSAANASDAQDF
jgi:hypothetical protein